MEVHSPNLSKRVLVFLFLFLLSGWFLIMSQGPARAGCLRPGRLTLGAHFGRVDGDQQPSSRLIIKN